MSQRIAILGLGLMGGSLALAMREKAVPASIALWGRRAETRRRAAELGCSSEVCEFVNDAVKGADLVILCVPVCATPELLADIAPDLKHGAVVTDVGSTKQWIEAECSRLVPDVVEFAGSHPIAGSHKTGLDAAHPRLYENSVTVVTPGARSSKYAIEKVSTLWQAVGSKVICLPPAEHDRLLARSSHLPHLAAAALTNTVCRPGEHSISSFCGTGFYDSTRIAAGSENLWCDIIRTNQSALLKELDGLVDQLQQVRLAVSQGDWDSLKKWLASARELRESLNRVNQEGLNE